MMPLMKIKLPANAGVFFGFLMSIFSFDFFET